MVDTREAASRRRVGWIAVLGACTVWLVIQNAVLLGLALAMKPGSLGLLATALLKATVLVIARFWMSPAAMALAAGLLTGVAMLAGPLSRRAAEARHG